MGVALSRQRDQRDRESNDELFGVAGALAPLVQGQLFGVTPRDPLSYVAAAHGLGSAACLAAWLPARRAATVSPIDALRVE